MLADDEDGTVFLSANDKSFLVSALQWIIVAFLCLSSVFDV